MSRGEIYEAFDAILSLEASGDFASAGRLMRSINKQTSRRTRK